MKSDKKMEWIYIISSVIGFTVWAFLQISFVKNSFNQDARNQLLFPIIVPFLASRMVCIFYWIYFKGLPNNNLLTLQGVNWIFIFIASPDFVTFKKLSLADFINAAI